MASRLIAQILLMGGTYVARAFVQAYQQALVNSARAGGASTPASRAAALRGRMSADEAARILGVSQSAGLKDIYSRYDRLFHANDASKGGSTYLQAKIHFAKVEMERIAMERGERMPEQQQQQQGARRGDDGGGDTR